MLLPRAIPCGCRAGQEALRGQGVCGLTAVVQTTTWGRVRAVASRIRDYGAPENGGLMYVQPAELVAEVAKQLA